MEHKLGTRNMTTHYMLSLLGQDWVFFLNKRLCRHLLQTSVNKTKPKCTTTGGFPVNNILTIGHIGIKYVSLRRKIFLCHKAI
jgi:hypothetical protein